PKPPNAVPKMAIWMIRPGTNQLNAFVPAPACFTAPSRSGPKRTRYRTGSIIPNTTQVGWRKVRMSDRWKMSQVSRMVFMTRIPFWSVGSGRFVAQRATGLEEEDVVEAGPVEGDRGRLQPFPIEDAEEEWHRRLATV